MAIIEVIKRQSLQQKLNEAQFDQNLDALIQLQSLFWAVGVVRDSLRLGGELPSFYASKNYVDAAINNLLGSAPGTLDTIYELAEALGNDPDFATTVLEGLTNRLRIDVANQNLTAQQKTNALTNLGLNTFATSKFITLNGALFSWAKKASNSTTTLAIGEVVSNGRISETIHCSFAEYKGGDINDFGTIGNDFEDGSFKNVEYYETA